MGLPSENFKLLELVEQQKKTFDKMNNVARLLLDECRFLYYEKEYYRSIVHFIAQKKSDDIDRRFPIMTEHYQFLRWDWM